MAETAERLTHKYLDRRKQVPTSYGITTGTTDEARQRLIPSETFKRPAKELKCYSKALHELFKAITNHPDHFGSDHTPHGSNEDLSGDTAAPLQDSQVLFTETDVTLPSCLDGSPGSHESETNWRFQTVRQDSSRCLTSSLVLAEVYQEMMTIYEQLRAERHSQREWERQLQEREWRLKQQEDAFAQLGGMEDLLHARILLVEKKHQKELSHLQNLLRERTKENKRLKSSFDTIKDLNDNMKKQLNEISEQNKKLGSQSKRVQARLENLQRKYEQSISSSGCQKGNMKTTECIQPPKKEKTAASGKHSSKGSCCPTSPKLLTLLLDWTLDGLTGSLLAGNKGIGVGPCLPPEFILNERCLKVLPLLADQLYHTPLSQSGLLLNLLRLIHLALRHLDSSTQPVVLSATLRRIGEQVSKPPPQSAIVEDPDLPKSCKIWPLYRNPCPHIRIVSILIILRIVTQADVLAHVLESLHSELMAEESQGLFIQYGGVGVLLSMLRAGRGGLQTPADILVQLTEPSCYLNSFLEACSTEEFFHMASKLLQNPHLGLQSLEKLSILLQKLSCIRKNRRLFELSSLHHHIKELYHKTNHTHAFLCLNLRSILHNLQ